MMSDPTSMNAEPPVVEKDNAKRCPICVDDWDVNAGRSVQLCCFTRVCMDCARTCAEGLCPLCRCPAPRACEDVLSIIRRHVDKDNPVAAYYLASFYKDGELGLTQSYRKAARLYQRAAELGDVDAMVELGLLYKGGLGVKLKKKMKVKYFRMAAERGCARAQFFFGFCFEQGDGVAQDDVEAARLYTLAADQGYTVAECSMGVKCEFGRGVARDTAEAIRWYERAAAKGDTSAARNLARLQEA